MAFLVLLALALPRLVDLELYRPRIVAAVRGATGRSVTLGAISLRLVPRPAFRVGPLTVAEGPRYPGRDAMRAQALSVRLGILDLLRGRVAIESIVIERPAVTLIRDARGRWSFEDLLAAPPGSAGGAESAAPTGGGHSVEVRRAEVRSGTLRIYDDAIRPGTRTEVEIGPVSATIRGWGTGAPTELDLVAGLGRSTLRAGARLLTSDERPRLEMKIDPSSLEMADMARVLPWLGVVSPRGLDVSGVIDLDGAATLPLEGADPFHVEGTVRLHGVSYRDAAMAKPVSGIGGTLKVSGDRAVWEGFVASLGSTTVKGTLQVEGFLEPRVGLTLHAARFDLNEVIAALTPASADPAPGKVALAGSDPVAQGGLLEGVTARGTLAVDTLRFQNFDLSKVRASVGLSRSVLTLSGLQAGCYGGRLEGSAGADVGRSVPHFTMQVRLAEVEVDPLLTAYDQGLKDLLRGKATGRLDLEARGADFAAIIRSARGSGALEIRQGSVKSISVLGRLAGLLEQAGGRGIGREETDFEFLRGTLAVSDGKARTDDLTLHADDLDLAGEGWLGLDGTLDLAAAARLSKESTEGMVAKNPRLDSLTGRDGRLAAHLRIQGDLAAPDISLDARAQAREIQGKAKERVKGQLRDRLKGLLERPGKDEDEPSK
jgi:uncharacterized protein involved in outer membrane biogenesis